MGFKRVKSFVEQEGMLAHPRLRLIATEGEGHREGESSPSLSSIRKYIPKRRSSLQHIIKNAGSNTNILAANRFRQPVGRDALHYFMIVYVVSQKIAAH